MGTVLINNVTPKNPITLIGECIGPCYGSDTSSNLKNYKRGLNSINAGHGRVLEYAEVWFVLQGYSARVIRELYTHIGGAPTRTQASTRYINYGNFDYIVPPSIAKNDLALDRYHMCMEHIQDCIRDLEAWGLPKEDAANVLPLGMTTTVSIRMNARTLISMAEQRLCSRAYWEYRQLMKDIITALGNYSDEWEVLADMMICKCDKCGWCEEEFSCGKYSRKDNVTIVEKDKLQQLKEKQMVSWEDILKKQVPDFEPTKYGSFEPNDWPFGPIVTCNLKDDEEFTSIPLEDCVTTSAPTVLKEDIVWQ